MFSQLHVALTKQRDMRHPAPLEKNDDKKEKGKYRHEIHSVFIKFQFSFIEVGCVVRSFEVGFLIRRTKTKSRTNQPQYPLQINLWENAKIVIKYMCRRAISRNDVAKWQITKSIAK